LGPETEQFPEQWMSERGRELREDSLLSPPSAPSVR